MIIRVLSCLCGLSWVLMLFRCWFSLVISVVCLVLVLVCCIFWGDSIVMFSGWFMLVLVM